MTIEELPVDERIATLDGLLARAGGDPDAAGMTGELGDAHLERYTRDGALDQLTAAMDSFGAALAAAPDHDHALWWRYRLGLGYAERADRTGDLTDYEHAIGYLNAVVAALPLWHEDRDLTVVALVDAYWDRFRRVRYTQPCPPDTALAEAERCAAAVDALASEVTEPEASAYVRVVRGQALIAVYDETDDPEHLDAGIGALAAALDAVGPQTPRYVPASADLCDAYRKRAWLGDDPAAARAAITAAIDAGQRAADTAAPDDPALPMLADFLAQAYQDRWDADDDPADLDRAIGYWRHVIADDPDGHALAQCGRLLRERAERFADAVPADEAATLLERAVAAGEDAWYQLGQAHHVRWKLAQAPGSLDRAAQCLDRAVAAGVPPDDRLLLLHNERLGVTRSRMEYESGCVPTEEPPSAALMRRHVDEARAAWERTAADGSPDLRAMLATMLAMGEMYAVAADPGSVDLDRVRELVAFGRTIQNPPPQWQALSDGVDALLQSVFDAQRDGHRDGGLEPLVRAIDRAGADASLHEMFWELMPFVLIGRAVRSGDRRAFRAAVDQLRAMAADDPDAGLLAAVLDLLQRAQHGDATVAADVRRLTAELRTNPPSAAARQSAVPLLSMVEEALDGLEGRPREVDRTPLVPASGLAAAFTVGAALMRVIGPLSAAITRHDVPALRECADRIAEVAADAPPGGVVRLTVAGIGGLAELEVARNDRGDRAAARRSAAWWAESEAIAGGAHHPLWSRITMSHGEALRLAGEPDVSVSRRLGLSALRGFGWQVLLQSGTDDAVTVAADAAAAAMRVAGWCRIDGADEDLVAALDAGRGLVLHAATTSRTIADQLADAGRPDLAGQWQESAGFGRDAVTGGPLGALSAGPEVPDDLRIRVLQVLGADDPVHGGTFTRVRPAEIRAALGELGADALVYLVPATPEQPGAAVIVPVAGRVDTVVLPDLMTGPRSIVDRHAAGGSRDAGPVDAVSGEPVPALDDVCRWAWSAAVGELLRRTDRGQPGRRVRLVLVPMGLLATVPWHAAFREDSRGRHYAIERAVFSYTVSARTLCGTARVPARPIRSALVVGDPNGDLPFAGLEAEAISRVFYPDGAYLGGPAGTGTPDQVLDWIAAAAPGPSLLHLACHGRVDPANPADAHLVLAGGTLTARRLLDASRVAELVIERVFLAACTTGVTGTDHDEAFSLSTAFLAAGARTVFGSLWSVPDTETSLLMFLVHHFLNAQGCAPVDALHRAQLWMLDPDRQPPPGMPSALARHCGSGRAADPVSWAAFTHQGR